jgi:Tir chaperone protein (CesT) family
MSDALLPAALFTADLVAELGGRLSETANQALVGLNNGTACEIRVLDAATVYLSSPLMFPDEPVPESLWRRFLEANYLWQEGRGAVFAVETGLPVLVLTLDLTHLSYDQFRVKVGQFLSTAATWVSACRQMSDEVTEAQRSPLPNHFLTL